MENNFKRPASSRIWIGIFIFIAGLLLLAYKMGAPLPSWLFSWPWILIGIGLITGLQNGFRGSAPYILILIGIVFLLKENEVFNFKLYLFPMILMIIGASFFLSPKRSSERNGSFLNDPEDETIGFATDERFSPEGKTGIENTTAPAQAEYVQINAILGGVKKSILSKNFTGGNITTFMGGAELNFLHADMQAPVILECNNIFGGIKLFLPSNWDLKNNVTAILGGVDDKRKISNVDVNPAKSVYLQGTCLFGGIEILNF